MCRTVKVCATGLLGAALAGAFPGPLRAQQKSADLLVTVTVVRSCLVRAGESALPGEARSQDQPVVACTKGASDAMTIGTSQTRLPLTGLEPISFPNPLPQIETAPSLSGTTPNLTTPRRFVTILF
jgi:hypothetical protein